MEKVEIVEVGPRDGLQNEKVPFSTKAKLRMINEAVEAGIKRIEVTSFVHPKLVPQMADAEAVVAGLQPRDNVTYIGLILNMRGLERALKTRETGTGVNEVGCVAVAADGFGQKNQGMTRAESIKISKEIIENAKREGLSAQVTISVSFGCPFDGNVKPETVIDMCKELAEASPREIAIADTIGVAGPKEVSDLFHRLREELPGVPLRAHFHNTRNTGYANAWAAFEAGASVLDASIAGLGGCPFAPRATGNIATEDLIYMLHRNEVKTDIDLEKLIAMTGWIEEILGHPAPGMVSKAGPFPK